jgi:hypothetical protein
VVSHLETAQKETDTMNDLDMLLAGVAEQATIAGSVQKLLANIADKLHAKYLPGSDSEREAKATFADMIVSNSDTIVEHVLAGTPMIKVSTARHPVPDIERRKDETPGRSVPLRERLAEKIAGPNGAADAEARRCTAEGTQALG